MLLFHSRISYHCIHCSYEPVFTNELHVHTLKPVVLCLSYSIFFGTTPTYIIADMDLVKEITVKHFDKFTDRLVRE